MIVIEHLRKEYPNATPLKDVNVTIKRGDVISIIGPSGTGKSTLIRCINLLETPTSGKIWVDDELITEKNYDATKVRRKMGMVFQSFNLFNHMNVIENVMAAQRDILKRGKQEAYKYGMELLKSVGLADKAFNYPDELSGGQKQRVAIARALAMDPEILLLDEPTSALDPTMVGEVQAVIRNLAENGMTLMIVTHEMKFAREIANRVFYMDDGGVYEDGTPEQIFDNPQKERTIRFIKHLKVFEYLITSKEFDFIEFNNMLDEYGKKNQISKKIINRALSVFEELVVQIILSQIGDEFKLHTAFEYSQEEHVLNITIKYDGKIFDVRDSDNILSLKIAQNASSSIEHHIFCEDEYTNLLQITIK